MKSIFRVETNSNGTSTGYCEPVGANEITYQPGQDHKPAIDAIITAARAIEGRARTRKLGPKATGDLLDLIDQNPTANTVRAYSRDGFVPNGYKFSADITRATGIRRDDGTWKIVVERVGAKRSYGGGSLLTVDNRGV